MLAMASLKACTLRRDWTAHSDGAHEQMNTQTNGQRWLLAWLLAGAVVVPGMASPAVAQTRAWDGRGFVTINGGLQAPAGAFTHGVVFAESGGVYAETPLGTLSAAAAQEQARFDGDYASAAAALVDAGAGVRVWRHLAIGVAVSYVTGEGTARVSAQAPHPFFFNRDREIANGVAPGLAREEIAFHIQAHVRLPVSPSVTVALFGGPTVVNVERDLVADVRFRQDYPYETAAFDGAIAGGQSGTAVGFHAGTDVAYYFSDIAGVGVLARFSRATVDLGTAGGGTVGVPAGGLHVGGGLRLRF